MVTIDAAAAADGDRPVGLALTVADTGIGIAPERLATVKTALLRLSLLQTQRAVLMMPEMDFSR